MRLRARQKPAPPAPRANGSLGQITLPTDPALAVSRQAALSLSVVANARGIIVGIASQLSVDRLRGDTPLDPGTILTQPDPDATWPTVIGETIDDMIFFGESFWLVLRRDTDGFPTRARRLPWGSVGQRIDPDWSRFTRVVEYTIGGVSVSPRDVIHFAMPNLGVLRDSAAVVLDALTLQAAASRFTSVPLPAGILTNEGMEVGEADAKTIVADFDAARLRGETAFLQSMSYTRTAFNSADLQMIEALATMDARLARVMNVPVSVVAASPTGGAHAQLYANVVAALTQVVQQAIAPYLIAIEQTFSGMGVTPRGQRVAFNTEDWLRFAQVASPSPGLEPPPPPGGQSQT